MKCPNCSNEVPETANVCGYCGNRLKSAASPPQPQIRQAQPSSRGIPGWVWGLGGFILIGGIVLVEGIVLMGSFGLFGPVSNNPSNQPAEPVAPIQVGITATPPSSESDWVVAFEDDFSDSNNEWFLDESERKKIYFDDGGLRFDIFNNGGFTSEIEGASYSNVRVSVEAQPLENDGDFGLVCRSQPAGAGLYKFTVETNGGYEIFKVTPTAGSFLDKGNDHQILQAMNTPPLQITAECEEERLRLFVDGNLIAEAVDSEFSAGFVGVAATWSGNSSFSVRFDNFIVEEHRP